MPQFTTLPEKRAAHCFAQPCHSSQPCSKTLKLPHPSQTANARTCHRTCHRTWPTHSTHPRSYVRVCVLACYPVLQRDLRLQMLSLQWKELEYLHANFQNLAVSSSVLVGFGFTALGFDTKYHPEWGTKHSSIWELGADQWREPRFVIELVIQCLFTVSAAFSLGFNLLALFIATVASMCGPGMALRGPEGSVGLAVRHMEQQLKRSLRFFGRGVVAIISTLATVSMRNFSDIGFLGGIITLTIGLWSFHALWSYGTEIAEKFHVSVDRAVRGTFVYGPDGATPVWTNTNDEKKELHKHRKKRPRIACLWKHRWRPEGHSVSTPLWRLDKMIAFPYHDEDRVKGGGDYTSERRAAAGERQQMQNLVLHAQGPVHSVRMRTDTTGSAFDPMAFATYMHEVVMGTDDPSSSEQHHKPLSARKGNRLLSGKGRSNEAGGSTEMSSGGRW
mmetsp:Transcript_44321/g.116460  ORF Transcript_44321/g.116460 Transcript_44321/m.116460 type:complete len:446 (+) Transcript_44321:177-1514(+)